MKFMRLPLTLLFAVLLLAGCTKKKDEGSTDPTAGAIATSSKTATSVTLTWTAATDPTTPADQLMYKVITSTVQSWTNADSAESGGTTAMDWAANTLTTNLTSLTESQQYYVTLLVRNAAMEKSVYAVSDFTMKCGGKKLFLASHSSGNLGGKAGADTKCNAQKPSAISGSVKAVLVDYTNTNQTSHVPTADGRQPCHGNCFNINTYTVDWPLAASTSYCTVDMEKRVGYTTSAAQALVVDNANVLTTTPTAFFSGMNVQWASNYSGNCSNWSSTSGTYNAGDASATGAGFPASSFANCSDPAAILCAEM